MIRRTLFALVFAIVAPSQALAAADQSEYAHPHQLVQVDGRRLNLFCVGTGLPTVVFESGAGVPGWGWQRVQPAIGRTNRACVYDRAGLGFSDSSPNVSNSANAVKDLHGLLVASGLKPPFVLVGHSYGGMNLQLFAYTYPSMVSGLVLVEAQHEDELVRLNRISQGKLSRMNASLLESYRKCTESANANFHPPAEPFAACVGAPYPFAKGSFATAYTNQFRKPAYWAATTSEMQSFYTSSSEQLRAA